MRCDISDIPCSAVRTYFYLAFDSESGLGAVFEGGYILVAIDKFANCEHVKFEA